MASPLLFSDLAGLHQEESAGWFSSGSGDFTQEWGPCTGEQHIVEILLVFCLHYAGHISVIVLSCCAGLAGIHLARGGRGNQNITRDKVQVP